MTNQTDSINELIDLYTRKICSGLPEWNHSKAKQDPDIIKQKNDFAAKMAELKTANITDEKQALRDMDLIIARNVPDEHIQIRIDGENRRAADLSPYPDLRYKIPPEENNNLILSDEKFDASELFTLTAPSMPDEKANILVAEKKIGKSRVGVLAIDSFMIEMSDAGVRDRVDKIADIVLKRSERWNDMIVDLRGNGGGDADLIKRIGERMAGKKLDYADKIEVIEKEPLSQDGPPERYMQKPGDKTFTGNVYVLQDGCNASAAEGAIWMLRQMDRCKTIGENTHGAFAGGDVKRHRIGGGTLYMGNTYRERILNNRKVEEGKGIAPDIRSSSKTAYALAVSAVKRKDMSRSLLEKTAAKPDVRALSALKIRSFS